MRDSANNILKLLDNYPRGIFIADFNGQFIHANAAFHELTGYSPAELPQITFFDLIHPEDQAGTKALFNELRQEKRQFYERESRYVRRNRSIVWGEKIISILYDDDRKARYLLGMVEDVSERRSADDDLPAQHQPLDELVTLRTTELEKQMEQISQQARETAVQEERHRLARELHDTVVQLLYSMTLLSNGWREMAEQGRMVDPAASFQQLENLGVQALKELRLMIYQLRPPVLDEIGLEGALRQRLEDVENRLNINTELVVEGEITPLSLFVEEQLYDIAQEALNNALRHARAASIFVGIQSHDHQLSITIRDDGSGFNLDDTPNGVGMHSMRERSESIDAQLDIVSTPGKGTTVKVLVGV